jgi:cysteine desulfurase/selenocysteine lyase
MSTSDNDGYGLPDEAVLQRIANDLFKGASSAAIAPVSLESVTLPAQASAVAAPPPAAPMTNQELPAGASNYSFLREARPMFGFPTTPDLALPLVPGEAFDFRQLQTIPDADFLRLVNPLEPEAGKYVPPPSQLEAEAIASSISSLPFDVAAVRRDFPILNEPVNGKRLVWLDNAATTHKPQSVIDRISFFYAHDNSNIHRAAHTLAARATDAYEAAREKVRRFLHAPSTKDIVFVRGATEGINFIAQSLGRRNIQKDDEIVITWLEHHANIVPWQMLCAQTGAKLRVAPVDDRGQVILEEYEKLLNSHTKLVSIAHVSNALGTITPVEEMTEAAHRYGAVVVIDGAQAVSHMPVDVQLLDCDFYVFSGHKVFAPTGIGVVFGKADVLEHTPPWHGGGNMISDVTFEKTTYQPPPGRFEAGTGSIADAVGLGAAIDYLDRLGMANVARHEHELLQYATAALKRIPGLRLIGTAEEKASVLSFVLDGFQTEDVGKALNSEGIAVRAGHHCAQPILRRFGVETTVRPSLALYNTCEDVDALINAIWNLKGGRISGPI